ncbi:SHD1 domain-containing protein [Stieleria sp. TO1_6]|uniref:SHD1 domain-containing protein n=1 Tax=Stieleria tagensis TaxID=2956795 RepID=UPI00209AC551|nr:SHD1 domain-containing protein [Stieleria tagensis]MCO8123259.1 SHD1 domain-containing protein [Stieleria tagensis]
MIKVTIESLLVLIVVNCCACLAATPSYSQESTREWTDSTGRFKITGTLLEVSDGNAMIKNTDGKTIRIPITRLSKPDQEFLNGGENPFQMVESESPTTESAGSPSASGAGVDAALWATPKPVNWDDANQFSSLAGVQWQVPDTDGSLGFEPKRAALPKKSTFHENLQPLAINVKSRRAAVGNTVSFGVPKPQSRLSLVDLVTGKSIHSNPVEGHMRPLALLDNGSSVLMVGCGDQRSGYETKSELQLWRFDGKTIVRSASWTPYPNDKDRGRADAEVYAAEVLDGSRVLTISDKGHLVLWDLSNRKPIWHARLSERNFAMKLSVDRSLLALFDEKTLMVLNPETAEILGSTALAANTPTGWCRVAWSPSGNRILLTSIADIRVMDIKTGQWSFEFSLPGGPVATDALSYPDERFALLNNRLLVDLESKIQVCEYSGASQIESIGGMSFIAVQTNAGGVLVPAKFPHPAAEEILETAQKDPSLFLLHPGVAVSIDVSGVSGQYQQTAKQGLEKSVAASGYQLKESSPIKIVASISGPKQEAVNYIAAGSYIVNKYTSTVKLEWNGKTLWSTARSNVPGMLVTKRGQTMQEALDEAGKAPNTSMFAGLDFPEFMQEPKENQTAGNRSNALMSSQFTLQGLVDSK